MRILRVFFLLTMTAFVGCGSSSYWYRPGLTLKEVKRDCKQCHFQANTEAMEAAYASKLDPFVRGNDRFLRGPGPAYMDSQFSRCMELKGYRRFTKEQLGDTKRKSLYLVTEQWFYYIAGD